VLSQRVAIGSAWSPLRHPTFSRLLARLVDELSGGLDAERCWRLVDDLADPQCAAGALMQTAISLPMCLLSLPAGVLVTCWIGAG